LNKSRKFANSVNGKALWKELAMTVSGFRVAKYDDDLQLLDHLVMELLVTTRDAMTAAYEALNDRNLEKAEIVANNDDIIDDLENMIHKTAHDLIMRYQPIAQDLRQILASMRVASDLERIGDIAESISRRVLDLGDKPQIAVRRIGSLGALVCERFNRLIEAYKARNAVSADDIRAHDDEIDSAYYNASSDILTMMENDPSFVRAGAQLLSVAKSFERVGDRLTNIAEQILYVVDGKTEFETRHRVSAG
jgi:phosphate transport system protein